MKTSLPGLSLLLLTCHGAWAQETSPLAKGIQDNSFLIEEAYNQEAGVTQYVTNLRKQGKEWLFTFTHELPIRTQTHQFSYSIPRYFGGVQGFGDVNLSYRYQALTETKFQPAFAPRVSLLLPTGDRNDGTGNDSAGYEVMLPISKIVSDRITLHANAGLQSFFDVAGHQPTSYRLGGSAIYALSRETNLMLEMVADWVEDVNGLGRVERDFEFTLLPGVRHAFNFANDAQLVVGAGVPIVFNNGETEAGVFLYLSYEHRFN